MRSLITIFSEWLGLKKRAAPPQQPATGDTGMVFSESASSDTGFFTTYTATPGLSQNDTINSSESSDSDAGENSGSDGGYDSGGGWDSGGGGGWS